MVKKVFGGWRYLLLFIVILALALYLRFHGYETDPTRFFGWDQARDAWKIRDIIQGQLVLDGPKTGIGNLHLGPLYFYLVAPFYLITKLDPVGSIYFLIFANIVNFFTLFVVTKKLFSLKAALFAVFLFAVSNYIIKQSMIPWNVSLVPAASTLIFYSIYRIKTQGKMYWYVILGGLMGFFFHLHFTAVFLPAIVILSLFPYNKKFKTLFPLILSFLIASIFLIPTLLFNYQHSQGEYYRYTDFITHYTHGFHGRFFMTRLVESFVQFRLITFFPLISSVLQFIIPAAFFGLIFFEKDKKTKLLGLLMLPWFIVPLIAFTVYAGPVSDYYYYFQMPLVIFIIIYLQIQILKKFPKLLYLLIALWVVYAISNTQEFWVKKTDGGLNMSKRDALVHAKEGRIIEYHEGDIRSYLYEVWTEDYPPPESID